MRGWRGFECGLLLCRSCEIDVSVSDPHSLTLYLLDQLLPSWGAVPAPGFEIVVTHWPLVKDVSIIRAVCSFFSPISFFMGWDVFPIPV